MKYAKIHQSVVKRTSMFYLLLIVANKWKIRSLDSRSVFLQGKKIDGEIDLKPPVETGTSKL